MKHSFVSDSRRHLLAAAIAISFGLTGVDHAVNPSPYKLNFYPLGINPE